MLRIGSIHHLLALSVALSVAACGRDSGNGYPYSPNETHVIGLPPGDVQEGRSEPAIIAGVTPVLTASTSGSKLCLGEGKDCQTPAKLCGDHATADVIVDSEGNVVSIVCYPDSGYAVVPLEGEGNPELGNNVVAVIDGRDDGVDVDGDLLIEGNNVIVFGDGPATSVIGGNLEVIKNNAIVRGVRIVGDAIFRKNNASLVDCVIEGNLTIIGNNTNVALCEIWGDIVIDGVNTVLVSNLIAGDQQVAGKNLRCNDNHRFTDIDGDRTIEDDDVLGPVNCSDQ
jgi:hypothetical protein